MTAQEDKARAFRALHEREEAFVIPNPWDVGSSKLLEALGFEALASTSSGYAYSIGLTDGNVTIEQKTEHCRALCEATALPVNADLEKCFADRPEEAAANLATIAQSGIAGASIEDYTGDPTKPIYDFELAVERVHACVDAARALDYPFTLTARAENLLHGRKDLDDTIKRLQAFEAAGAQVLYAPGLTTLEEVRAVTGSLGRPVNVLAPPLRGVTVRELADAGAKRISVGGALSRAAYGALIRAAKEMTEQGSFNWSSAMVSTADIEGYLLRASE